MLGSLSLQFEEASRAYAEQNGITRDPDWFMLKLQEEVGELTQTFNRKTGRCRSKGLSEEEIAVALADEAADVLGHILLFAKANDLDIEAAIERKWRFRPEGV